MNITPKKENARGCGYRKPGGLYLVTDVGALVPCCRLPLKLDVCPTCHGGIKFSRGFTKINPKALFAGQPASGQGYALCKGGWCPLVEMPEEGLLMWVGEKFYADPLDWIKEVAMMGASKRISQVPRGFEVGKTRIYVAHRKVQINGELVPAIFHSFTPTRIEYVVKGDEDAETLEKMEKKGFTLVSVTAADQPDLFEEVTSGNDQS